MEENGQLVQFIFNTEREVVAEKENEWTIYIRGSELLASSSDHARTYYHYASDEMGSITHIVDDKENPSKLMNWNEFQNFNRGKYTNSEMSDAWHEYKKENYPNAGEHYLKRPYLRKETIDGITRGKNADGTYYDANTFEPIRYT